MVCPRCYSEWDQAKNACTCCGLAVLRERQPSATEYSFTPAQQNTSTSVGTLTSTSTKQTQSSVPVVPESSMIPLKVRIYSEQVSTSLNSNAAGTTSARPTGPIM